MKNYTLKVQDIRKETEDTITLCFKQPGLKKIKYQAGQYITLSCRINNRKYNRPYSFSSSPLSESFLEITIKRVPNGLFSNYIHDTVKIGDAIEIMEPMGDFVFTPTDNVTTLFFWGVGSGITPLISIIKEVLISNKHLNVVLTYGNKNPETTIFLDILNNLQKQYASQFKVFYFYSQCKIIESKQTNSHYGRISNEFITTLVQDINITATNHFICGPLALKNTLKDILLALNCPESNIFSEDFELVKNPKDFEDIVSQNVQLLYKGVTSQVLVPKGKSVLEAALDTGLELPYSCQTGNCDTCKGKLHKGTLRMIGLSKNRDDLNNNEFLLCCSHPLSDNVLIEI
ncbi:MAG: 2Fe-2S iron-sulfur cluster binding domain-containing protein [Sphingobacteriaceae bacterium]|nr:2Fe-2S iron-sulfur cluster binding domain-containing protein [Sphingobacteriaceae bacterium]